MEMRQGLAVYAPDVADVIHFAGGLLCDRAMAGWKVTVHISGPGCDRPLHILGAAWGDFESALTPGPRASGPHALAVAADLYRRDPRVRAGVVAALDGGRTEVTVWGTALPQELEDRLKTVHYEISAAARAFKRQALAAVDAEPHAPLAAEAFGLGGRIISPTGPDPFDRPLPLSDGQSAS